MDSFEKFVYKFSRFLNILSGISLVALMGLVFVNVALRALWQPILGAYEFVGFLSSITIALALAHCAANNGHVAITLFVDILPERVQTLLDMMVGILGTVLFTVLFWQCVKYAFVMYHSGEVSPTTETPLYPFLLVVSFGLLMLALVLLNDVFKSLIRLLK